MVLLCGIEEIFCLYCFKGWMEQPETGCAGGVKVQIWISNKLGVLKQLGLFFSFSFLIFPFFFHPSFSFWIEPTSNKPELIPN